MIYIIIYIFITTFFFYIIKKNKDEDTPIKFNHLKEYILQIKNKRKIYKNKYEKHQYNDKTNKINIIKYKNIKYKKLNKTYSYFEEKDILKDNKNMIYSERLNIKRNQELLEIALKINTIINSNKQKYRAIERNCIIDIIAKSFAHSVLIENNFNVFDAFKEVSSYIKIYKKEAQILPILIISNLIQNYIKLQNDIIYIKKQVLLGRKCRKIRNNFSCAKLYGVYLFNHSSSKFIVYDRQKIFNATNFVLNEIDSIFYKQRIIFNYIKYLYRLEFIK